jgi:hypothetical protein
MGKGREKEQERPKLGRPGIQTQGTFFSQKKKETKESGEKPHHKPHKDRQHRATKSQNQLQVHLNPHQGVNPKLRQCKQTIEIVPPPPPPGM